MSYDLEIARSSPLNAERNTNGMALTEIRDRTKEKEGESESMERSKASNAAMLKTETCIHICLIAKLQSVFFPMKLFGLFFEDVTNPCQNDFSSRRTSVIVKRAYQVFVLLILWINAIKTFASLWINNDLVTAAGVHALVPLLLWYLQTALQGTICFFTMHLTSKKSSLKSLVMYWNTQPNFHELVTESYMIKSIKRTLLAVYFLMAFNAVLYGLILFHPSESLQPLAISMVVPFPDHIAVRIVAFVVSSYCTAAWLMPFAIFTAVCLTLLHQIRRLRKTLRLTASANEIRRIKIVRQQHSSLCGSVRKVDNLFKFLTLVVYVTNIPLVCFLLFDLIFLKSSGVTTQLTLSFWFVTVAFIMVSVSFLGAHLNSKIHSFTEVVQKVQIANVDLDTHTELMLFIAKLNGDPVAITAGGLVHITKPLIVTVTGVVITYFALLYELR